MGKYDFEVNIHNETEMLGFGRKVADVIDFPMIMTLVGDLGAGKTTLTRGMLGQLGHLGHVKSPTFSIVEMYEILSRQIAHFDMYRITDEQELEFFGFKEYFDTADLIVIEWPNRISGLDFSIDVEITITIKNNSRDLIVKSRSDRGSLVLKNLKSKIQR